MRERLFATLNALLSASLVLSGLPAHAGGVDVAEFTPIPVNVNDKCSAVILKGTNMYRGYAFKMPRVVLSVDKNLEDVFEIIPKGNGQYTLRFGLFFPLKDDGIAIRQDRSNLFLNTCNDDVIVAELNDQAARQTERNNLGKSKSDQKDVDPKGTIYADKITTLSPMPVSAVEISIDGFPSMTKMIGLPDNNLLGYQNTDLIADFQIPDEGTYDELKTQLTGRVGLSVNVKLYFNARSSNGRTEITLHTKDVANSLEGLANAYLKIPDPTGLMKVPIGDADLRGYLATAAAQSNSEITTEEGDNDAYNRMSYQLLERVVSQIPSLPQIPGSSWNPNACINNPSLPNCQGNGTGTWPSWPSGGYGGTTGQYSDPNNPGGNGTFMSPPPPAVGNQGPVLQPQKDDGSGKFFSLGAVVQRLKQMNDVHLIWQNSGKRETQSYTTKAIIRGTIPDPGYRTLNTVAGDVNGATYTSYIKQGQQVIIKVPSQRTLVSSFEKQWHYFSRKEIQTEGIANIFQSLQEALNGNALKDQMDRENGGYVALYQKNQNLDGTHRMWQQFLGRDVTAFTYSWGVAELHRVLAMGQPEDLDLEADDLAKLPLKVTFSEYGQRFNLGALVRESDLWSAEYKHGQIVLTAKEDLGYMTIRNYDKISVPAARVSKYLFERKQLVPPPKISGADMSLQQAAPQFTWFSYTGDVSAGVSTVGTLPADFKPFQIKKSVYVILVRVGTPNAPMPPQGESVKTTVTPSDPVSAPVVGGLH